MPLRIFAAAIYSKHKLQQRVTGGPNPLRRSVEKGDRRCGRCQSEATALLTLSFRPCPSDAAAYSISYLVAGTCGNRWRADATLQLASKAGSGSLNPRLLLPNKLVGHIGGNVASKEMQDVIDSISDFPLDVEGQRKHYERVWKQVPVDPDIKAGSIDVGGIGAGNSEWVWTEGARDDKVFFYYHGGGYVCGEPWMWRQFNGRLSRASGMRCLAFGYRLAPEHPFPTAIEDCVEAYLWLLKSGTSPKRIVLVGDSAGGALVLSVMMALRDRGEPLPAAGVPMSPWTDLELKGETMTPSTGDPLTTEESARSMAERFLGGKDPRHPWASALYGDLKSLPPLHIEAGERDVLYSDSTRLVQILRDSGNEVNFFSVPGAIHSFPALAGPTPEAATAIERMAAFMRRQTSD